MTVMSDKWIIEQVEKLTKLARDMNVGVICSGQEAKIVRKKYKNLFIIKRVII